MGQSSGMGRLIGTLHHQLQILQQPVHAKACRGGGDGRLRAHGRQGHPFGRRTDPVAEQITGPMEEVPQHRIRLIRGSEGVQAVQVRPEIGGGVHRLRWNCVDPRVSWEGVQS